MQESGHDTCTDSRGQSGASTSGKPVPGAARLETAIWSNLEELGRGW
jgi:hypothetical protein